MSKVFITQVQKQISDIQRYVIGTRKIKKVSQETLAKAIGVSRVTYTERENDIRKMRLEEFLITLDELGIGINLYERGNQ